MSRRFYSTELDEDPNIADLNAWVAEGVLVGIADEDAGIIAYCHRSKAPELIAALEAAR